MTVGLTEARMVRLPADLADDLAAHCARTGAAANRVIVVALRALLGDGPAVALPVQPPSQEETEAAVTATDDPQDIRPASGPGNGRATRSASTAGGQC